MSKSGILDNVRFLFSIAQKGVCGEDELRIILNMTEEHTDNLILGRVFGYSVSDYAIATLKWIGSDSTLKEFKNIFDKLSKNRQTEIETLISRKLYLE